MFPELRRGLASFQLKRCWTPPLALSSSCWNEMDMECADLALLFNLGRKWIYYFPWSGWQLCSCVLGELQTGLVCDVCSCHLGLLVWSRRDRHFNTAQGAGKACMPASLFSQAGLTELLGRSRGNPEKGRFPQGVVGIVSVLRLPVVVSLSVELQGFMIACSLLFFWVLLI